MIDGITAKYSKINPTVLPKKDWMIIVRNMTSGKLDDPVLSTLIKDGNWAMIGAKIEKIPKLIDS